MLLDFCVFLSFFSVQVGAPPQIAHILEEIRRESGELSRTVGSTCMGVDPELDEFMVISLETLCRISSLCYCASLCPYLFTFSL